MDSRKIKIAENNFILWVAMLVLLWLGSSLARDYSTVDAGELLSFVKSVEGDSLAMAETKAFLIANPSPTNNQLKSFKEELNLTRLPRMVAAVTGGKITKPDPIQDVLSDPNLLWKAIGVAGAAVFLTFVMWKKMTSSV